MTAEPREVAAPDPLLLTAYLEAPYADVAAGVRSELAKHAEILDHQLEEPREAFRQRVLDTLLLMTESKQTGMGFPTEYGGGGDIGASIVVPKRKTPKTSAAFTQTARCPAVSRRLR